MIQFTLRFPDDGLKERLQKLNKKLKPHLSFNAFLIDTLAQTTKSDSTTDQAAVLRQEVEARR